MAKDELERPIKKMLHVEQNDNSWKAGAKRIEKYYSTHKHSDKTGFHEPVAKSKALKKRTGKSKNTGALDHLRPEGHGLRDLLKSRGLKPYKMPAKDKEWLDKHTYN